MVVLFCANGNARISVDAWVWRSENRRIRTWRNTHYNTYFSPVRMDPSGSHHSPFTQITFFLLIGVTSATIENKIGSQWRILEPCRFASKLCPIFLFPMRVKPRRPVSINLLDCYGGIWYDCGSTKSQRDEQEQKQKQVYDWVCEWVLRSLVISKLGLCACVHVCVRGGGVCEGVVLERQVSTAANTGS